MSTIGMAVPDGVASDSALSDVSSGYNERSSKRPRLMEPGFYFAVPGSAPGFVGAHIVPPMSFGYKRACMFSPDQYLMSPSIYRPSHATIIQGGESISGLDKFPAVRIRGPPFNCTELDIYNFFSGLSIVDCLLMNKNGHFTGEAYVVFSSPMLVNLALQRVRQNMGHHYVEVSACKKSDYYNAVAAQMNAVGHISAHERSPSPAPRNKRLFKELREDEKNNLGEMHFTEVLKLCGLPYSVTKTEIIEFFGDEFDLKESDIDICCRYDGKEIGVAFAKFSSAEVAKKAMCRDQMIIGSRYVELLPSTTDERSRASTGHGGS